MTSLAGKAGIQLILLCYLLPAVANAGDPVTVAALAGRWQATATAFARVSARRQVHLSLPFAARIIALKLGPGAQVIAGEELARFDAPLLRQHLAAWEQALQAVDLAQKGLRVLQESARQHTITRYAELRGEQAVAQATGRARLSWEVLAADLERLHLKTDEHRLRRLLRKMGVAAVARRLGSLRAPFDGVVTGRRAALGEQLAAGEPVFELQALAHMYLEVGVPEAALPFWRQGASYWRSGTEKMLLRPLDGIPLYEANTGLWLLRFAADNPGGMLRAGAWVEVEHRGAPEVVVWVPAAAVVARNGRTWCMVAEGRRFKAVEVHVGMAEAGRIPVLSGGLQAGDRVVTRGAYELLYRDLIALIKYVD